MRDATTPTPSRTERLGAVRDAMAAASFDALLVAAAPKIAWISGFHASPYERLIAAVVPGDGRLRLVVPMVEDEAASEAVPEAEIIAWSDADGPREALRRALAGVGGCVGIEKNHLTVAYPRSLLHRSRRHEPPNRRAIPPPG